MAFIYGKIGAFDTKSGLTAVTAGSRAEGLQKHIESENKKGRKMWGGIAIYANGTWRCNSEKKYHYDPNSLSSWKILQF